jgi:hypothetical protein
MAALIQHRLWSFVFFTDLRQLRPNQVSLPEVGAESALPVINVNHADLQVNDAARSLPGNPPSHCDPEETPLR